MISPVYSIINTPLLQIAPNFHGQHTIYVTLYFINWDQEYQVDKTRWKKLDEQLLIINIFQLKNELLSLSWRTINPESHLLWEGKAKRGR